MIPIVTVIITVASTVPLNDDALSLDGRTVRSRYSPLGLLVSGGHRRLRGRQRDGLFGEVGDSREYGVNREAADAASLR